MSRGVKISLIIVLILLLCGWLFSPRRNEMTSTVFCAYGRVFVEFDHDGYLWGTTLLDREGKPIPCQDEIKMPASNIKNFI